MEPGMFRFDPDNGYPLERRELAVAWSESAGGTSANTYASILSVDDSTTNCSVDRCALTVHELTPRSNGSTLIQHWEWSGTSVPWLPLSLAVGGFKGRGLGANVPTWGVALSVNDSGADTRQVPNLYMLDPQNEIMKVLSKTTLPTAGQVPGGTGNDAHTTDGQPARRVVA